VRKGRVGKRWSQKEADEAKVPPGISRSGSGISGGWQRAAAVGGGSGGSSGAERFFDAPCGDGGTVKAPPRPAVPPAIRSCTASGVGRFSRLSQLPAFQAQGRGQGRCRRAPLAKDKALLRAFWNAVQASGLFRFFLRYVTLALKEHPQTAAKGDSGEAPANEAKVGVLVLLGDYQTASPSFSSCSEW